MLPIFAGQFRKPSGLIGHFVSRIMVRMNHFIYPALGKHAGLTDRMTVLEIGYGPGTGMDYLINEYGVIMDGIDFSRLMFRKARKRNLKNINNGRLNLFIGEFESHDFGGRKYDRVIFANVIYFWKDIHSVLGKIRSLLSENGKLVFYMTTVKRLNKLPLTRSGVFLKYELSEVLDCLSACGFRNGRIIKVLDESGDFVVISAER